MQELVKNNALKEAADVVKARWPEVLLVVAIQVGLMLMFERIILISRTGAAHVGAIPDWAMFVLGAGYMLMAVIWQMLYLGFLRTAALNGPAPHDPMTLLMTGRSFFWRFLGVQFILVAILWFVAGMVAALIGWFMGYGQASSFPAWLPELAGIVAIVLLLKPFFLIPAIMLALNASTMEAFMVIRQIRFADLGLILKGYALGLTVIAAAVISATLAPAGSIAYYIAAGASYLIQSMTILVLMLATTLFLAPKAASDTESEE